MALWPFYNQSLTRQYNPIIWVWQVPQEIFYDNHEVYSHKQKKGHVFHKNFPKLPLMTFSTSNHKSWSQTHLLECHGTISFLWQRFGKKGPYGPHMALIWPFFQIWSTFTLVSIYGIKIWFRGFFYLPFRLNLISTLWTLHITQEILPTVSDSLFCCQLS